MARVCPQGTSTCSIWPVCRSVRRSWTGRMQPPCSAARSRTTSRASGMASRCALVVRGVMQPPGRRAGLVAEGGRSAGSVACQVTA